MPTLAQLAVFLPAAVLVAASPGANNLLALRNGVQGGTRAAIVALRGRAAAFLVMVLLVAAGLGAVLARSQTLLEALRIAGAAYLLLLGVRALLGRGGVGAAPATERRARRRSGLARQELLVAAANPKALL